MIGDVVNRCPNERCGSKHALSIGLLRTDVIRFGRLVSLKTGNLMRCIKCGCEYASTEEGVMRLRPPRLEDAPATQEPEVKVADRPARTGVTKWQVRERTSPV